MANPNPKIENIEKYKWKKGQSPNPKGKPKGTQDTAKLIEKILSRMMEVKDPFTGELTQISAKEALLLKQFHQAIQGSQHSFDRLFDRLEGKPVQKIDQNNINTNYTIKTNLKDTEDGEHLQS